MLGNVAFGLIARHLLRHRLASGTDEKIQLSSMVAAFQAVRDLVVSEAS